MSAILYLAQPLDPAGERHTLRLVEALAAAGTATVLAWGGIRLPALAGVELAPLPPAGGLMAGGHWILDPDGQPVDHAWKKRRAAASLAIAARVRPALLLLDGAAFGSGAFRFELKPLLEIAARRQPRPLIAVWSPGGTPLPVPEGQRAPDRVVGEAEPAAAAATLRTLLGETGG